MSQSQKHSPLDGLDSYIIWMEFDKVLDASNELPPSQAQSENRDARAVRRSMIRELEEQQAQQQASVSESDISGAEYHYAAISSREDAVFYVLSMLPCEITDYICSLAMDSWDFE